MDAARGLSYRSLRGDWLLNLKKGRFARSRWRCQPAIAMLTSIPSNYADMVFVPRMELVAEDADDQGEIAWEDAITVEAARTKVGIKVLQICRN